MEPVQYGIIQSEADLEPQQQYTVVDTYHMHVCRSHTLGWGHCRLLKTYPSQCVTVLNLVTLGQNSRSIITEIHQKNFDPCVLPFKVKGHCHGWIGYL